jgi:hypothetical protein
MNLKYLNLDRYDVPEDAETQMLIFLIAAELKVRKLNNGLINIGCDGCFCMPDLSYLVLALADFDEHPDELYDFYFGLLDQYCEKVTHDNTLPIEEALCVYKKLMDERLKGRSGRDQIKHVRI